MAVPELATVAMVKAWLGITDTSQDTIITRLLNAAEYRIRGICNRPSGWVSATFTEKFNTVMPDALTLTYDPIASITSISVVTSSGASTSLDSTNYRIDDNGGIVRMLGDPLSAWATAWPTMGVGAFGYTAAPLTTGRAYPYVSVVYVGGYSSNAIPEDLQQAAVDVASILYRAKGSDLTLKAEGLGHRSYTRGTQQEVDAYIYATLGDYIRPGKGFFG